MGVPAGEFLMHIPFNDLGRLHRRCRDFENAFRRHLNSSDFILGNGVKRFEEALLICTILNIAPVVQTAPLRST